MNSPVWNSASEIDDLADELLRMIDQTELCPTSDMFYQMRLIVADVQLRAGHIMERTKDHPAPAMEYVIGGDPGVREPAAVSTSRQAVEIDDLLSLEENGA